MYQTPNLFVLLSGSRLQGLKHKTDDFVTIHAGASVCCWAIPLSGLAPHPTPGVPAPWLGPAFQPSSTALRTAKNEIAPVYSGSLQE